MINAQIAKDRSIKEEVRKKREVDKKYNLYTEKVLIRRFSLLVKDPTQHG